MKHLDKILLEYQAQSEIISTDDNLHGMKSYYDRDFYNAIKEWLTEFKDYLPPKDVTEHAKGAHDAIDDLLTWIHKSNPIGEKK